MKNYMQMHYQNIALCYCRPYSSQNSSIDVFGFSLVCIAKNTEVLAILILKRIIDLQKTIQII